MEFDISLERPTRKALGARREADVTYNFDPDKWCENERLRVEMRQQAGELTEQEAAAALERIDRRYEAMLARLDGTFPVGTPTARKVDPPERP